MGAQLWREGIEGAGRRLAKSDERAVGEEIAQTVREERTARGRREERERARVGGGGRRESDSVLQEKKQREQKREREWVRLI